MKKCGLAFLACALLVIGCQTTQPGSGPGRTLEGFDPKIVRKPEPLFPNVFITDDALILVDQEPIRVGKRDVVQGRVTISWALEAGSPYRFPSKDPPWKDTVDGIVIGPGSNKEPHKRIDLNPIDVKCRAPVVSKGKVFECSFQAAKQGQTRYKYTVNVLQGGKLLEPLDPSIEGAY